MLALSSEQYIALTPPMKTVSDDLIYTLEARGLIVLRLVDSGYEQNYEFSLTSLGQLAIRVYEMSIGVMV